ncbi:bax inhibitor 1-like isoform X2 [Limulus polyphemus]|uniref:Bax inhibitor 1-like isoform X2 n=2 Tax=Limulus polyphemus TaxID=6850 RepID=A0ABM1S8D5_LIMPO|nr:bax inhibitor 1-like isoform X2 [Limulus polyphemus]
MSGSYRFQNFFNTLYYRLSEPERQHLRNVYSCVALSTFVAAAGGYIHVSTDFLQGGMLSSLISFAFLTALATTSYNGKNTTIRLGFLLAFAFCAGLSLGPLLEIIIMVNPKVIPSGFLATSVIFICFSLSSILSEQGKWLFIGGSLFSLLSTVALMHLVNMMVGSTFLFQVNLYIGLVVICGFILYDTQMIIEKQRSGERDFIW